MERIFKHIFVVVFLFAISTPLAGHLLHMGTSTSVDENRELAKLPELTKEWQKLRSIPAGFDQYFNDRFGFKKILSKFYAQITYLIFKKSPSSQISVGKDGYLFFNSHSAEEPNSLFQSICGRNSDLKYETEKLYHAIQRIINFGKQAKINTYFIFIPTKSKIYPDKLPGLLARQIREECSRSNPGFLGDFFHQYRSNPLIMDSVFYPLNLFRQHREEMDIYYRNHFHWIGAAPFLTATHFLHNYAGVGAIPEIPTENVNQKSDLHRILNGVSEISTITSNINTMNPELNMCMGAKCWPKIQYIYKNLVNDGIVSLSVNSNLKGRRAILLSDSFGIFIAPALAMGYEAILHINVNHLTPGEWPDFIQILREDFDPIRYDISIP